eukprot:GILI01010058.1.p1 GENE.GILI01010058.1~~GILI01010058.1.p1  ORF type:complete len:272 (+),score=53.24 GILI01010058.1:89-817(+)
MDIALLLNPLVPEQQEETRPVYEYQHRRLQQPHFPSAPSALPDGTGSAFHIPTSTSPSPSVMSNLSEMSTNYNVPTEESVAHLLAMSFQPSSGPHSPESESQDFDDDRSQKSGKHKGLSNSHRLCICRICLRTFANSSNLSRHMLVHNGRKPHVCEHCGKCFSQRVNLVSHVRIHTGEKPHTCPYEDCGKAFASSSSLRCHLRVHTNERPFSCSLCPKAFKRSTNLNSHLKKIHGVEKVAEC